MKIIAAANAMLANQKQITSVIPGREHSEMFFLYGGKYKWSILKMKDDYALFYYPTDVKIERLASWDDMQFSEFSEMIRYSAKDIGSKEAMETFSELYRVAQEREYGIDDVLDDIIQQAGWT